MLAPGLVTLLASSTGLPASQRALPRPFAPAARGPTQPQRHASPPHPTVRGTPGSSATPRCALGDMGYFWQRRGHAGGAADQSLPGVRHRWAVAGKEQWPCGSWDSRVWGGLGHRQRRAPPWELALPSVSACSARSSGRGRLDVPWLPVPGAPLCRAHCCQRQRRGRDPAPRHPLPSPCCAQPAPSATFPCPGTLPSAGPSFGGPSTVLGHGHQLEGARHASACICWGCGTPQWAHEGLLPHAGVGQRGVSLCHGSAAADPHGGRAANTSAVPLAKETSRPQQERRKEEPDGSTHAGKASMPEAPVVRGWRCQTQAPSPTLGVGGAGRSLVPTLVC